jgi:myosin-5
LLLSSADGQTAVNAASSSGYSALDSTARLFEIEGSDLEATLVKRSISQPGGRSLIIIPLTVAQAVENQEGLAKAVYSKAFDWVVERLNQVLSHSAGQEPSHSIGVLDIFGFEIFTLNSFEQLCINLANEKLQGHFNEHIFKLEMRTYAAEGLDCRRISFVDNQPIIDLLEKKPDGVLPLVDDECVVPKGSDSTLLGKLQQAHAGKSKHFGKPPRAASADGSLSFVIQHYAGPVLYSAKDFLAKNRDILQTDLESCMANSGSSFLQLLFPPPSTKRGRALTLGGQFRS